jgi:hypothetical protein
VVLVAAYQMEQIKRYEEARDSSDDSTQRKQMEDMIAQLKPRLERAKFEQEQAKLED